MNKEIKSCEFMWTLFDLWDLFISSETDISLIHFILTILVDVFTWFKKITIVIFINIWICKWSSSIFPYVCFEDVNDSENRQ
jgi:hypothetical protein